MRRVSPDRPELRHVIRDLQHAKRIRASCMPFTRRRKRPDEASWPHPSQPGSRRFILSVLDGLRPDMASPARIELPGDFVPEGRHHGARFYPKALRRG